MRLVQIVIDHGLFNICAYQAYCRSSFYQPPLAAFGAINDRNDYDRLPYFRYQFLKAFVAISLQINPTLISLLIFYYIKPCTAITYR